MFTYSTIDAHVAGETVRLVVDGAPTVRGETMADRLAWMRAHGEPLRRALVLEPRGHAGIHAAMLTEPGLQHAHAGLLTMNAAGFPIVSGEAVAAAAAIALEQNILVVDSDELRIDTPAGLLSVRSDSANAPAAPGWPRRMILSGLDGYALSASLNVKLGTRRVRVDVAFGGQCFAIADSEAAGVVLDPAHAGELIRAGERLRLAVDAALRASHPGLDGVHGVVFTAPGQAGGHLRTATVLEGGVLHRSPGITTTVALMAVFDAMGVLDEQAFVHEGLIGTTVQGRVARRRTMGETATIAPLIECPVWMTGRHRFEVYDGDPLKHGFAWREPL